MSVRKSGFSSFFTIYWETIFRTPPAAPAKLEGFTPLYLPALDEPGFDLILEILPLGTFIPFATVTFFIYNTYQLKEMTL